MEEKDSLLLTEQKNMKKKRTKEKKEKKRRGGNSSESHQQESLHRRTGPRSVAPSKIPVCVLETAEERATRKLVDWRNKGGGGGKVAGAIIFPRGQ